MNNEQFSFGIKVISLITCIILVALIILVYNVLTTRSINTSILDEVSEINVDAQIENNDEFKQYLEVFALLVQEENPITEKQVETVISFLNQIVLYETVITEEGYVCYDKEITENVARELLGVGKLETGEDIILDEKYNAYRYVECGEFLDGKCMDILSVEKQDNIYNVEYTCTFPGETELYELSEGNKIDLSTYKIKATLQKNENYEYSKYYLKNIELQSKDIVQYN